MNFQVYLEPDLARKIDVVCRNTGRKRNAVIRDALKEYVEKHMPTSWPDEVFSFRPDPKLIRFESLREDFLADREVELDDKR